MVAILSWNGLKQSSNDLRGTKNIWYPGKWMLGQKKKSWNFQQIKQYESGNVVICKFFASLFRNDHTIEWSICDIIQSFRNLIGTGLWGVWLGSDSLVGNYTPHSSKTARISFVCGIHSIVHLVLTFFTCLIFFLQSLRNIKYLLLNKGWQVNQVQISKIIIIIVRRNFTAQL